jgi:hypothetical protein
LDVRSFSSSQYANTLHYDILYSSTSSAGVESPKYLCCQEIQDGSSLRLEIQPDGWGICLFSLNVSPEALAYYTVPGSDENFLTALTQNAIGEENFINQYNLFGVHDFACIFKRSPNHDDEEKRESVIENIANWSQKLLKLQESPDFLLQLRLADEMVWEKHLQSDPIGISADLRPQIKRILSNLYKNCGYRPAYFKPPVLYNYTHDALRPLYPRQLEAQLIHSSCSNNAYITAFTFVRIDPRILATQLKDGPAYGDCWSAYQALINQLESCHPHVTAVWAGLGMSQLVLALSCTSLRELSAVTTAVRDGSRLNLGYQADAYAVVSMSSTLITMASADSGGENYNSQHSGFYILVRLWSGFHNAHLQECLLALAALVGIAPSSISIAARQGIFDLIVDVNADAEYKSVRQFVELLDCVCPFVEDVATIVRL